MNSMTLLKRAQNSMNYSKGVRMKEISLAIFGTEDYKSMLAILSPYDGMVRKFNREVKKLEQLKGEL